MRRVVIIGAGPGGLATAIALRRAGLQPAIFERADGPRDVGSGLTLWPNALQALDLLGAAGAVWSACLPMDGIALRSSRGDVLTATPRQLMERVCGGTGSALLRSELNRVLSDHVGDGVVSFTPAVRDTVRTATA